MKSLQRSLLDRSYNEIIIALPYDCCTRQGRIAFANGIQNLLLPEMLKKVLRQKFHANHQQIRCIITIDFATNLNYDIIFNFYVSNHRIMDQYYMLHYRILPHLYYLKKLSILNLFNYHVERGHIRAAKYCSNREEIYYYSEYTYDFFHIENYCLTIHARTEMTRTKFAILHTYKNKLITALKHINALEYLL